MSPPNPSRRPRPLANSVAALLLATVPSPAQTYTAPGNGTFTNPLVWNFGAGPGPASDAALALRLQSFGGSLTALNDLNLTLQMLDLAGNGTLTLASLLGGDFAFSGAGAINFGSSATVTLSAGVVLGSGLTSLTFDGAGAGALTVSGVVSSNTAAGAPLVIATDAGNASTGIVKLSGANTFSGGVVLNSGTLDLANARALGDRANSLTINGGNLRTASAQTVANNVTLNGNLKLNGSSTLTLAGVLSGAGGVTQSGSGSAGVLQLRGINTYAGATTVRALDHAATAVDNAASIYITGAAGSILQTSGIGVSAGGTFRLQYGDGHSAANSRVSAWTSIGVTGGFLETFGNDGLVTQSLGTVNPGGLTTIVAGTAGGVSPPAGAATEVAIANLIRSAGGTVTFTGPNLGGAAAGPGLAAAQGNVLLTLLNGAAPAGALVGGGGGAGTPTISILPWALGDIVNTGTSYAAGSGFVTYTANGVRLLNTAANEYNTSSNFNGLPDNFQNMRISGSVTSPLAPVTVNSIFVGSPGLSIGGANAITITSGALASNVLNHTIAAPVKLGAGGAGEGLISVVGPLSTTNTLTISGTVTAGSLVKSGHGTLILSGTGNTIAGGITINGGQLSVSAIARLGGATSLTFNSPSQTAAGAGLTFTGSDTLGTPIVTNGGIAGFNVTSSTLNLNSNITGAGGLRKDGAGTLVLAGTNSYSGGTYLGAGTLQFDADARLGAAGGFLHTSGGVLNLTGPWTSARALTIETGNALQLLKGGNTVTLSGPINGTGPLQIFGAGTLTIASGDNGYAGTVSIGDATQGGTLALAGPGALNAASVTFGASAGPAGTYRLDLSAATAPSGTPWRSFSSLTTAGDFGQAHTVQLGSAALTPVDLRVSGGSFGGAAGVLQGFGKLVKTGPNPFTLNGTLPNPFTGGVEIWSGRLDYGADAQLGNLANGITIQGGTLNATADSTTSRAITLAATPQPLVASAVVTLANSLSAASGTALTLNGTIGGSGGFNKSGTGTINLGTTNNYAGDTQITAGILTFTDNAQLGAASSRIRLGNGTATLRLTAAPGSATTFPLPRTIFVLGGTETINAATATATLDLSGQILAVSGAELSLSGPGKFIISGDNRSFFAPVRISSGETANTITLGSTGQLRRATLRVDRVVSVETTFNLANQARELGAVQNLDAGSNIALGSGGQLTTGFNNIAMTWDGNITGNAAAAFTKTGTGSIALTASGNTFGGGFHLLSGTGTTTISANGALPFQNAMTLGAWGNNTNRGPLLALNNASDLGTRLADTQAIFSNAGEFQFTTNGGTATSETVGSLRGAGLSIVTMNAGGTLNFGDVANGLTRVNRGTFLFRAGNANMGTAAVATTAIAKLTFGNLPGTQLVGGGGAIGTRTISILPYAVGGITGSDPGSNFVTYGANGVRVLNTDPNSEVRDSLTTAAATENVRLNTGSLTTTTISGGDKTVNALNLAGTASRTRLESATTEKLIVSSGLILSPVANVYTTNAAGTAGVPLGIQVAELQTGAANTRELNVFAVGDLALGAKVTTSGGLTKSGAGALYLGNSTNTFTGATTVNAGNLVIDNLAALGGSTQLQLGGGFLKYRGPDATLTGKSIVAAGGSGAGLGASAGFHVVSGTTLDAASTSVSGNGGILKDGSGVLRLTGANTNSGATLIAAGALAIDNPAALGTNPRVVFTDSAISTAGGQTLRFDAPMTLTQDFIVNSAQNGTGFGFDTNGNAVTLSGTLLDARSTAIRGLYKFGAGELNLTGTEMFTGASQIFGGTLRLSGANGSLLNSTGTGGFLNTATVLVNPGAALVLDNAATNNNNRLPDVWDTPFGTGNAASGALRLNGGELKIIGHAAGTSERTNQLDLFAGTVTLSGGGTTLTSGLLARTSAVSAGLIRGTNLGALPGPGNTNWFVTDLGSGGVQLGGAGGAEGTPFINLLPGFMGDTSATGSGTDFLTYAADTGFRTLTAGEYSGTIPAGNFDLNRAPNVALTGAASVNQTTALTALKLGAGASVGGPGTLLLGQSTVLATGNASIDVPSLSTNLTDANAGYVFLIPGAGTTLTVGSILPGAGLMKYGEGTLALNGRYTATGAVTVAQGTLRLDSATAALNPLGSAVTVLPGATFDLGGSDRSVASLNTAAIIGSFNLGQVSDGTVALGANRLTIYDNVGGLFTGDITGTGGVTKASQSSGTSTFTQPLSYTGSTVIRSGILQLAGAGTLASTAVEIRGGTLAFNNTDDNAAAGGTIANRIGTSTPITLAGGGIAFTENANTPGNHNLGPITLAGGSTLTITSGSSAPSTVSVANLARSAARGTLNVNATNLGLTQSPIGGARIFLTQIEGGAPAAALSGGGGAVGTTNQSILPWAFQPATSSYLTYGADGLRPLATSEYATSLISAGPTDNVRSTGADMLVATTTVNSLVVTGGNVTGAFDLTLDSGGLSITGAGLTLGAITNALLTGSGNTRELVINDSGGTTLDYNLTTSGGVTKSGAGALILGGTNTFTGGLTINEGAVNFASDANLGTAGGAVRFGGGSATSLTYTGSDTLAFNRAVETTGFGAFTGAAYQRWQLNQAITGAGGIGYATSDAVFEINAANNYTGPTQWSGGHLYIDGDSAFGNGGEILLATSATGQDIVLRGNWTSGRLIHAAGTTNAGAIQTNGYDATWSGQFVGSTTLNKNGTGNLILTEAMPYSGALTVNAGAVVLRDRGSLAANACTHTVNAGAALTLDDTGTHSSDRLHDNAGGVTLNGGSLNLLGSGSATTEEVFNGLALGAGASTVTLTPGSGQAAIVRLAGLPTNAATAASLWRGTNLGVNAPGTANSANLLLTPTNTNEFPLIGGGAPAGHPSISIIRGGFGDTSATGLGTQLVTYDPVKGVRLLHPATEFTATLVDGSAVTDNVKADGSAIALPSATTINALWLKDVSSVTGIGELTLTSGNLLVTGIGNIVSKTIRAGSNALAIGGSGDVTFDINSAITSSVGLIKTGAGTLTLSVANTYGGDTVLKDGVFAVGDASAFASTGLFIQGGEIRNVSGSPLTLVNNLTLNGPMKIGGAEDFEFSGFVTLNSATREIETTNTGTTTFSGAISSSQTLINYGLTKTGPGLLVLANTNFFDGPTTVHTGTLETTAFEALGYTASVAVNAGGTLLLSSLSDQVNDSAPVTLAGGKIRGAVDGLDEQFGTLTLSANSVIDFGTFASGIVLRFDDSSALGANWTGTTLSVWNWTAGLDRLYIGVDPSGLLGGQLSKINFYSNSGTTLATGFTGGLYNTFAPFDGTLGEVSATPVPEPSGVVVGLAMFGLAGWRERRKSEKRRQESRRGGAA